MPEFVSLDAFREGRQPVLVDRDADIVDRLHVTFGFGAPYFFCCCGTAPENVGGGGVGALGVAGNTMRLLIVVRS